MIHFEHFSGVERIMTRLMIIGKEIAATSATVEGLFSETYSCPKSKMRDASWWDATFVGTTTPRQRMQWLLEDHDFTITYVLPDGHHLVRQCHFLAQCFWTTTPPVFSALLDSETRKRFPNNGEFFGHKVCYPEALNYAASTVLFLDKSDEDETGSEMIVPVFDKDKGEFRLTDYRPCYNIGFLEKEDAYYFFGPCVSGQARPTGKFNIITTKDPVNGDYNEKSTVPVRITNERVEFLDLFNDTLDATPPEYSGKKWNVYFYSKEEPSRRWPCIFAQNTSIDVYQLGGPTIAYPDFFRALKFLAFLQKEFGKLDDTALASLDGIVSITQDEVNVGFALRLVNNKWRLVPEVVDLFYTYVEKNTFVTEVFKQYSASEEGIVFDDTKNQTYITSDSSFTAACFVLSLAFAVNTLFHGCETDFFIVFEKLVNLGWITFQAATKDFPSCYKGDTSAKKDADLSINLVSGNKTGKLTVTSLFTSNKGDSLKDFCPEGSVHIVGYDSGASKWDGPDHWVVGYYEKGKMSVLYDPYRSYTALSYGDDITNIAEKCLHDGKEFIMKYVKWEES